MRLFSPFHRFAAIVVLVVAAIWIATGEFSSVGSKTAESEQAASESADVSPSAAGDTETAPKIMRTVEVIDPVFVEHSRRILLPGTTQADKRVVLAARTSGVIDQLDLEKGQKVEKDQVIMTLEGPEALANERIAEITLDQSERDLVIAQRLYDQGNTPEQQFNKARTERDSAQSQLSLARAAVDKLQLEAPFSGVIDDVNVERGEWVQTGTPIATILSLDPIIARAEISERDISHAVIGADAKIRMVNGTVLDGKVSFVSQEASAQTRTFPIEIELPNPDLDIPVGMTADIDLFTSPERAVIVPRSIITLSEAGEIGLRIVGSDNLAQFQPVSIVDDTEAGLVLGGVPEDVKIVVSGQDLVRDGDEVILAQRQEAPK